MSTGRKGQQWGTVGVKNGVTVRTWLDKEKRAAYKALCKKDRTTMSLDMNKHISTRLSKVGVYEPSQSFSLT